MGTSAPSGMFALELDLATSTPTTLTDAELVDAVIGLERLSGWVAARQAAVLAELMARPVEGPQVLAVRDWAGYEIAMALTVSRGSAEVRLAHAARLDGVLRPTRDLLETGRIDPSRARLICDRLAVLDDAKAGLAQERVLARAPGQTWSQLAAAVRRAILAVDPDGAAERHQKAKKQRRVDVFPDEDGMATFWARMSAPDAASSFEWLTRLARGMGADDPRTLDQRRADLVAAAVTGKLVLRDPVADPADLIRTTPVTPGKPLITVLVPYTTLTGADEEPCEIAGYGPIPAHLARDIAADAVWRRLLFDPRSGVQLDYGREVYRPPAGLADFVRGRDVVCRAPGCPRAAGNSELDHVVPWGSDGHTAEDNLCTLCTAHHDLKEQPGWQVVLHPDGQVEWITPTGHHHWTRPHDHRSA
ncbi:MAG: DUF222 domain-containing protein [Pseudonocardia sp.]|nr:DUF222 domain-containing protein [Pseudonocardia sp.]